MKILYANHYSKTISGAERVMLNMARALCELPDVELHAICPEGKLAEELRAIGIPVHTIGFTRPRRTLNPFHYLSWAFSFIHVSLSVFSLLKKERFDILFANSFIAHLYTCVAVKLSGVRNVWHMHDILKMRFSNRLLILFASAFSTRIVAVSEAVKKNIVALGGAEEKVEVVLNGIDLDGFDRRAASEPNPKLPQKKPGELFAVIVGQIAFFKGQHVFVEAAMRLLRETDSPIRFLIAGDVQDPAEKGYFSGLKEKIENEKLQDRIVFLGHRADVPAVLSASDILVHASATPDPCPLAVLEYLYSGKAVVAADTGGAPEMITDGENGFLFSAGDAAALAERIGRLAADPELRSKLGAAARRRAAENHNLPLQAANLYSILKGL